MKKTLFENVFELSVMFPGGFGCSMAYLINGDEKSLIDSGPKQFGEDTFVSELAAACLEPKDISALFLTHGHADHIGGTGVMKDAGVPVAVGEEDRCWLENHKKTFDLYVRPVNLVLGQTEEELESAYESFAETLVDEIVPDRILQDEEEILPGIRAVAVPGHTPGSFGFFCEKSGLLFAGDNIAGGGFPGGSIPQIWDLAAYSASLDRLTEYPISGILTAHPYQTPVSVPATERGSEEVSSFIHESKEMCERLIEQISRFGALKDRPAAVVADEVIAAMPEKYGYLPLKEQGYAADMTMVTIGSALRMLCGW